MVVGGSHQEILDPGFVLFGHYVLRFRWWLVDYLQPPSKLHVSPHCCSELQLISLLLVYVHIVRISSILT
ncbi:unnamed protein product [Schistosoma margrebowiei]|uniref:Uncharacterized protein n=1 Tax=Schistosoma margrebowiei TaxID=48269 RepID=A0A183LE59_9TREM|nr:unnamed protein product [Schistosoma margrebowiei]